MISNIQTDQPIVIFKTFKQIKYRLFSLSQNNKQRLHQKLDT